MLRLIDKWGNETTVEHGGHLDRIKHHKVLAALEKRALKYRYGKRSTVMGESTRVVDTFEQSARGDGGFGSTGKH